MHVQLNVAVDSAILPHYILRLKDRAIIRGCRYCVAQRIYVQRGTGELYVQRGTDELYIQYGTEELCVQCDTEELYIQCGTEDLYVQCGTRELAKYTDRSTRTPSV
jgi:hypothetical protein